MPYWLTGTKKSGLITIAPRAYWLFVAGQWFCHPEIYIKGTKVNPPQYQHTT